MILYDIWGPFGSNEIQKMILAKQKLLENYAPNPIRIITNRYGQNWPNVPSKYVFLSRSPTCILVHGSPPAQCWLSDRNLSSGPQCCARPRWWWTRTCSRTPPTPFLLIWSERKHEWFINGKINKNQSIMQKVHNSEIQNKNMGFIKILLHVKFQI